MVVKLPAMSPMAFQALMQSIASSPNMHKSDEEFFMVNHFVHLMNMIVSSLEGYLAVDQLVRSVRGLEASPAAHGLDVPLDTSQCNGLMVRWTHTFQETWLALYATMEVFITRPVCLRLDKERPSFHAFFLAFAELVDDARPIRKLMCPPGTFEKGIDRFLVPDNPPLLGPKQLEQFTASVTRIKMLGVQGIKCAGLEVEPGSPGWQGMVKDCRDVLSDVPPDFSHMVDKGKGRA